MIIGNYYGSSWHLLIPHLQDLLKAPKNATVAIIQTTKNKMTFIIVAKIKF